MISSLAGQPVASSAQWREAQRWSQITLQVPPAQAHRLYGACIYLHRGKGKAAQRQPLQRLQPNLSRCKDNMES